MKKIFSVFISVILILLPLTSCGKSSTAGKSFSMPVSVAPECLDPQIATSSSERLLIGNCFEGLMRLSNGGKLENGVAESYSVSSDSLTYTFNLRQNTKWHYLSDYKAFLGDNCKDSFDFRVTAKDFVFGLRRALDKNTKSADAVLLYAIKNAKEINSGKLSSDALAVRAVDDYTLEITLSYPDSNFLYALTKAVAMPCNEAFWNATEGKYGLSVAYTLCNGPFYLSKWTDGESLRIAKNADYSGKNEVKPASVWFYVNTDEADISQKCATGVYDVAFLNENQLSSIDASSFNVHTFENTVCSFLFNCSDSVFSNSEARKAICYATDLSSVSFPVNISSYSSGVVPPYCTLGDGNYREQTGKANIISFDSSKAVSCFNSAISQLKISSLKFTVLCPENYESTVKLILQSWQKTLGIKLVATVDVKPLSEVLKSVQNKNYSVVFYPLAANEQNTENYLSTYVSTSGENILNFSDTSYDSLFSAVRASGNKADLLKAENYLLQNAVILPLFNQNSYFVTSSNVSNIYFCSGEESVFFLLAEKED